MLYATVAMRPSDERSLDIFSWTDETLYLFNKLMDEAYASSISPTYLEDDLAKLYDGLIWAEKKNPLLVYQMFEMQALEQILGRYMRAFPIVLLRNSILLLGNCESQGLVAQQLVEHAYPHSLLQGLFEPSTIAKYHEQVEEYLANFLKCYYKLFKAEWLPKFILPGSYFELLQLNLKFYNCPEAMARTNALNIVLDLLRCPQVRQFIASCQERAHFYEYVFGLMTKLFRNELAEFGLRIAHISKDDTVGCILSELEDKIALWEDISANSEGIQHIFQVKFVLNLVFPLVLGPLRENEKALFSLKYSLFVCRRLIKIMQNFNIIEAYLRVLFMQDTIMYEHSSLSKAFLPPFDLTKLTVTEVSQHGEQQQLEAYGSSVKNFYDGLLRSKDNHFILMTNTLMTTLFKYSNKSSNIQVRQACSPTEGWLYNKIMDNLLKQLECVHRLNTINSILDTLIALNNYGAMEGQGFNRFIYFYQQLIGEIKASLKPSTEHMAYLSAILQHDLDAVEQTEFGLPDSTEKYENLFKVVFVWEASQQLSHGNSFYARVPDSPSEYLRHLFTKFMLIRKAKDTMLGCLPEESLKLGYHSSMVLVCPYTPGDIHSLQDIQSLCVSCRIVEKKGQTEAIFVRDENFLIIGVASDKVNCIDILYGVHLKLTEISADKKYINILIKQFNRDKNDTVQVASVKLKMSEPVLEHLMKNHSIVVNKHYHFVRQSLEKTVAHLPKPSFI